ncbi:MAG: hypothetical protein WA840_05545 [Caulobacteraceae bacterium]
MRRGAASLGLTLAVVLGGAGDLDNIPEQAFLNVGGVESVLAKAKTLQDEAG